MSTDETPHARRVFVYEVDPCQEDGSGTSGWTVTVVVDRLELTDVLRVMRVEIERLYGEGAADRWIGIKTAKLITVAVLDPRIA
jgi:hypothetical protein